MNPYIKTFETNNEHTESMKKVLIIAGVHGNELTPIVCLQNLIKQLNGQGIEYIRNLSKLTICVGANVDAIRSKHRTSTLNINGDLNRAFNTSPDVYENLNYLIDQHDIIIDVHSSPNITECALINIDEHSKAIIEWCNESITPYICRYFDGDTIKQYCLSTGKYAITLELNGMDVNRKSAQHGQSILTQLLISLPTEPLYASEYNDIPPIVNIIAQRSGIINSSYELPRIVKKGEILGHITALDMSIKYIISPIAGIIMGFENNIFVNCGEEIGFIKVDTI